MQTRYAAIKNVPGRYACDYCMIRSAGEEAIARGEFSRLTPIQIWLLLVCNDLIPAASSANLSRDENLGDGVAPIWVCCRRCGREDFTSCYLITDFLRRDKRPCRRCGEASMDEWTEGRAREVFASVGLEYLGGAARMTDAAPARCMRCGGHRRVSLSRLIAGVPPCLDCDGHLSTGQPHFVYLIHFERLHVYKVGITHSMHGGRIRDHIRNGGKILDALLVADRVTAFAVEHLILGEVHDYAAGHLTRNDLPQGGWTETWDDSGPMVNLVQYHARIVGNAALHTARA